MALSLTTAVKNKVAQILFKATYANVSATYQADIDGEGASALTHLETFAQWYTYLTAAANAPDEWEPWYVYEIAWRISPGTHPERDTIIDKRRARLQRESLQSYTPSAIAVSPSASEAFVYNVINNRRYVLSHCANMKEPFYPKPHAIDAALDEALTLVWNKAQWHFARRPVRMKITRTAFTGGTWTNSTKTISGLTSVSTSLAAGTRFYVTGGTSADGKDHVISSTTSTTIVLDTSLGSAANGSTNIAGFYYVVTFEGMQASESFDSIASGRWFFTDTNNQTLCWADSTQFAALQSTNETTEPDTPKFFRTHMSSGTATTFLFWPPPDADYEFRGEILVKQMADPTSTTDTIPFDKFAAEFMPAIRKLQLAMVLQNHGRHDAALNREVQDQIESLFPTYQSPGDAEGACATREVYGDVREISGQSGFQQIGGGV